MSVSCQVAPPFFSLSIITIVRNDQEGLDLTIKSVSDNCPFAQHVVVDGSDYPLRVDSSFASLTVLIGPDRGISHAFNRGIMSAVGRYVLFINAGDNLIDGVGEEIEAAANDESHDCHWFSVFRKNTYGELSPYRPRMALLKYAMAAPHQGMMLKRDIFFEIGLFPLQKYSMDHHFALRFISRVPPFRTACYDTPIAQYPVGGHSTKGGFRPFVANCWNVARIRTRTLPNAILANLYLSIKSFFARGQ